MDHDSSQERSSQEDATQELLWAQPETGVVPQVREATGFEKESR